MPRKVESAVIVIFGASGDLTARKLIPALYERDRAGELPAGTCVLGVSRTKMSDDQWRDSLKPWAKDHAKGFNEAAWMAFAKRLHYFSGSATEKDMYPALQERIASLSQEFNSGGRILFYLSVAPSLYEPIIGQIELAGLVTEGRKWCSVDRDHIPWQRIIIEKPFGTDLESAAALNRTLGRVFEEDAIYRIDHYLGKELVQNLLVLRFANTIFEPLWNHQYIDHIQITAAETVGVENRAGYYDGSGAIRDMIQSHLLQVLALVAMEPPSSYADHAIRQEKVKAIDAIEPPPPPELNPLAAGSSSHVAFGQFAPGNGDPGYTQLPGVGEHSTTETFAAIRFHFDNWRWAGMPFYLRTGKCMAKKKTEVVIQFKPPAVNLFKTLDQYSRGLNRPANRLIIDIAPREGASLRFEGKVPGSGSLTLDSVTMDVDFAERFGTEPVEAYGPLILDALRGDQTLFKHRYEVEGSWRAVMPYLGEDSAPLRENIKDNYAPGSWGPACADEMLNREGRAWHNT